MTRSFKVFLMDLEVLLLLLQPESGCPNACISYGHPENCYVLNCMIAEGECKQSWFSCFHKYSGSKPYTNDCSGGIGNKD